MEPDVRNRKKKLSSSGGEKNEIVVKDIGNKLSFKKSSKKIRADGDGESAPDNPPNEFGKENLPSTESTPLIPDDNGGEKIIDDAAETPSSAAGTWRRSAEEREGRGIKNEEFFSLSVDGAAMVLFVLSFAVRAFKLDIPKGIVFDELHYGKYVGHYMKNTFFFDSQPPLGKQLIALAAHFAGFTGDYKFERIGGPYDNTVPISALRIVPVIFGSLLAPTIYKLLQELGVRRATALLAALLVVFDNALIIQTRYIFLEGPLLFFGIFGVLCVLRLRRYYSRPFSGPWWYYLSLSAASLTAASCVRYFGLYTFLLGVLILSYDYWEMVADKLVSDRQLLLHFLARLAVFLTIPLTIYFGCFYMHLSALYKAGPNDNIMTSSFQASLEGGLASIVANQPLQVVHGSQVTLRHSLGRACWLHSHDVLYPARYPDERGSSHQQQVTCYSYKDVNNWWIVKKPDNEEIVVSEPLEPIKDGDVVQLIHGLTSRALNSHDVASAVSPQNQEVTCYVDHNVSMPAQNLWRVHLLNSDVTQGMWHAVESQFRLIHVNSTTALKFSGRQLPEWGFKQHEIVTDKVLEQDDTIWNVEEHKYSRANDQSEREKELISSEMIPTERRNLTFLDKMYELQYKMIFNNQENVAGHMYASEPLDWLMLGRGVAYWVDSESNAQIHFIGNIVTWLSGTLSLFVYTFVLVLYVLRRQRSCYDLTNEAWAQYCDVGIVLGTGYLVHYLPYFLVDRTLFLHHYMPAYVFKICILAATLDHAYYYVREVLQYKYLGYLYCVGVVLWVASVLYVFTVFAPVTYGHVKLTPEEVTGLTWRKSWDLIIHKN